MHKDLLAGSEMSNLASNGICHERCRKHIRKLHTTHALTVSHTRAMGASQSTAGIALDFVFERVKKLFVWRVVHFFFSRRLFCKWVFFVLMCFFESRNGCFAINTNTLHYSNNNNTNNSKPAPELKNKIVFSPKMFRGILFSLSAFPRLVVALEK